MRPDTAGKNSFLFFWYCCLVTRILALSSLVLHRNGWWWWWSGDDGVAPWQTAVDAARKSVSQSSSSSKAAAYLCTVQRSKWIFYLIWFLLGWAATRKAFLSTPQTRPPARHNKVLGELQLSAADFENSIHTHNHEWVGDWMCAIRWWCWLREERLWLCSRIQFTVLAAGVRVFKE